VPDDELAREREAFNAEYRVVDARCRRYAWILGVLTALFALRVAGQALQRWMPLDALPAFDGFKGSALPYWLLLAVQLFILVLMASITFDVAAGTRRRNRQSARVLGWLGGIYMASSLGHIAADLALAHPAPWFTAWIPAFFHVVLAGFVVTLAAYHATSGRDC
jgi:uncharacterized membrane protein required for colicin V production